MCTASWLCDPSGFELFFNRDEQRSRPPAHPPRIETLDGVRAILPRDGQENGTWIGVNEFGLVVCILNLYEADYVPSAPRSRGHLVTELLASDGLDAFAERLAHRDLAPYRGFTLVAFDVDTEGVLERTLGLRWDGESATRTGDLAPPLISSGYDLAGVRARRRATWEEMVGEPPTRDALERYHASRTHTDGAYDVSMARPDACTVSHTRVRVTAERVHVRYVDGAPADGGAGVHVALERRARS